MSTIVGNVTKLEGVVRAINPVTGESRILEPGSPVYAGEVIQSSGKGGVVVDMVNGTLLTLGRDTQMRLDDDVSGHASTVDSGTEGSVDIAALQQAILEGNFDALEATAAGDGFVVGSASEGGVFVERIGLEGQVTSGFDTGTEEQVLDEIPRFVGEETIFATPTVNVTDDNGLAVGGNSIAEDASAPVSGTFTITAEAGVASINVAGTDISEAQLLDLAANPVSITNTADENGTLTITSYDAATGVIGYSYAVDGTAKTHNATDDNVVDNFVVVVTDVTGATGTDSLDIQIIDTAPVANDDANSITEDAAAPVTGNVVTENDVLGADATTVTTAGTYVGSYGTVTIGTDGLYSYALDSTNPAVQALNDGETVTDTFSYTLTDADGDTSTADLVITVNGVTDGVPTVDIDNTDLDVTPADNSVVEATGAPITGNMSVAAEAGIASVTVAGQDITDATANPVTITSATEGTLVIDGYDAATGAITYTYTEDGLSEDHSAGDIVDNFAVVVTDVTGATGTDSLDIQIIDTAPTAQDEAHSLSEDSATDTVGGDTMTNETVMFDLSANFVSWDASNSALYGTWIENADGTYSYQLDNTNSTVNALNDGESLSETFSYTISDADGDTDVATVTITIDGHTDATPTVNVTDDNGLAVGDNSISEDASAPVSGTFTITAEAGVASINVAGTDISEAQLLDLAANPVSITNTADENGTLTITSYDAATGVIGYSYAVDGTAKTHNATDDNVVDNFAITVTDDNNVTSAPDSLDILITDTEPKAAADARTVGEDDTGITGNVVTGTNASADTLGADTATVTGVQAGNAGTAEVITGLNTGIAGTYGTLTLQSDGSYDYVLNANAQTLQNTETGIDTFSYTLKDADGDFSTTTVTFNVTGTNDAPECSASQVITNEDTEYVYQVSDFGFSDYDSGDALQAVRIENLPVEGSLQLNGVPVVVDQEIDVTDINAGNLTFIPDLNESGDNDFAPVGTGDQKTDYASFNFSVSDGTNWSSSQATMTVDVVAVADAPILTVSGFTTTPETIDINNVGTTTSGFTVTAISIDGTVGTISVNDSPVGFGVSGASSGANSELGRLDSTGQSEEIVIDFDDAIDSVDISFAWKNSSEDAKYVFYNNGVNVGEGLDIGGSDHVDPAVTLSPGSGILFDQIVLSAPASRDDYLIHDITFEKVVTASDESFAYEGNSAPFSISASLGDDDGSETLDSLVISNIPIGGVISDGTNTFTATSGNTSVDVKNWNPNTMSFTGQADSGADSIVYNLSVTAISKENSNGDTAQTTVPLTITILQAAAQTAPLIDGIVVGIDYVTSSGFSGRTDSSGNFDYMPGDTVTFSIGNIVIGDLDTNSMSNDAAFLQDIAGVGLNDLNDEYVENMAVFLQSLDANSDAYDGIEITQDMHDLFSDDNFDLAVMSEAELTEVLAENGLTAVTEAEAMQHVKDMIIENTAMTEDQMDVINTDMALPAISQIEMDSVDITKLGNSKGVDNAVQSFDFGSEHAGQTVNLTFETSQYGNNKFESDDKFELNANGNQVVSMTPDTLDNHSYQVQLDSNGRVELEFVVDSDEKSEFLDIKDIKLSLSATGSDTALTDDFMLATDDADIFEITGQDDGVQINDFNISEDTLDLSEVITDNDQQVDAKTLAEYLDFSLVDSDGDGQADDTAITIDSNDEGQRGGDKTTIFIQDSQLTEDDISDMNIDYQND